MKFPSADKRTALIMLSILIISVFFLLPDGVSLYASDTATLKIGGTGGALGTMKELAAAFEKKHPGVTVSIIPHLGTRGGLSGLLKGAIDLGVSGRHLTPEELAQGLRDVEYGRSPLVFATRSREERMNLTPDLITRFYQDNIKRWPNGTFIRLVLRPEGDVDTLMLKRISPALRDAISQAESREGMLIAQDDQENCDLLEKIKGAFGTTTLTQIITEKRSITILPLNGVTPDIKTMVAGSYPYYKPFHMVTGPNSPPLSKEFIEFVKSPDGRKILLRTGNHVSGVR
jgi:phosphate transport system substrate-binding protein